MAIMRSPLLSLVFLFGLGQAQEAAIHTKHSHCSYFTDSFDFSSGYNTTFHNATYFQANTTQQAGVFNQVAFCEVTAEIHYAEAASLNFAIWLPDPEQYQDRFVAVGNGGLAGFIDTTNMMVQLNSGLGFAVAGGDSGHDFSIDEHGLPGWAQPGMSIPFLQHQARTAAWLHDAISIFTHLAKDLTTAYYGQAEPRYMYYNGCSTGGGQGFSLAQYHPELYDGIFAGSPANYYSHGLLAMLWESRALSGDGYMTPDLLNHITNTVLDQCDEMDGLKDGQIQNPLACPFEIETLSCTKNSTEPCLTQAQLQAAQSIYRGARTTDTDEFVYAGYAPGSENQWTLMATQQLPTNFTIPVLQNLVYRNLSWDASTSFHFTASDIALVDEIATPQIAAVDTDLASFRARGGKLLSAQGWDDQFVPPLYPIHHRQELLGALKGERRSCNNSTEEDTLAEFYNLFMVPGLMHCGGATTPDVPGTWHPMEPLVEWVERGVKPVSMVVSGPAADGNKKRTRKACVWPATARYVGGDEWDEQSFVCE